jgi:hypothetical protein
MIEALGLVLTTLSWFAAAFLEMFVKPSGEWLLLIPFTGAASLLSGVVLWLRQGRPRLYLFLFSPAASLLLVFIAGIFRGKVGGDVATPLLVGFLAGQAAFLAYALYRCRVSWMPAVLFAYGFFAYAIFSSFVAAMAFTGQWI